MKKKLIAEFWNTYQNFKISSYLKKLACFSFALLVFYPFKIRAQFVSVSKAIVTIAESTATKNNDIAKTHPPTDSSVTFSYTGGIQTWSVPPCVTTVTIICNGAAGGTAENNFPNSPVGGDGASVTAVINVISGHTLNILAGQKGINTTPQFNSGGGGGGGSFVWDVSSTVYPLVAAGGGGGGCGGGQTEGTVSSFSSAGAPGSITLTPTTSGAGYDGASGTGGGGGIQGTATYIGVGGGGAGWTTAIANPTVNSTSSGAGGLGEPGAFIGGAGSTFNTNIECGGGYGSGGGAGNAGYFISTVPPYSPGGQGGGGGGGGGYNGGGGGSSVSEYVQYGGGGGGSGYYNGAYPYTTSANFVSPVTAIANDTGNGSVTIIWTGFIGTLISTTNVACNAGNDGSATIAASDGTVPYTYSWVPIGGNNATGSGLTAGTYTVNLTDANGCMASVTVIITQPPALTTSTSFTPASCNLNNGSATVSITGGTTPYTYLWNPSGETNSMATGLSAGTYVVTIIEKNGCTSTATVTITQPSTIISTKSSSIGITCNGNANGSMTLSTTGGTSPYTYSWAPTGGTTATGTGLSAGTYTITVTDANGCNNTTTVLVTQPAVLTPIITVNKQVSCNGDKNGSVTVNPTGGTSPYTYLWSPVTSTKATVTGLSAGTYTVAVTDINGCSGTATVTITQPNIIHVSITSAPLDSACIGQNLTLRATGATTYVWSNGGTTSAILVVVPTGNIVTYWVKGFVGACYDSTSITIKIIQPITASMRAGRDTVVCPGGATTMTAMGIGGSVTYLWSNGSTTSSITVHDTVTTIYTVVVSGPCNSVSVTQKVTVIPLPQLSFTGSNWVCAGGSETITVSSATNPTTYLWSNGNTSTAYTTGIINKDTTIYIIATNSLGCSIQDSFKITERLYPTDTIHYPRPACADYPLTVTADITSGIGPFTYQWNTGATTDSISVTISDTTSYTVTVSNGCSVTQTTTIAPHKVILTACCDTKILLGQDTVLVAKGTNIKSYSWSPAVICLNSPLCDSVLVTPQTTTTYTVTGIDTTGCPTEVSVTIKIEIPCLNLTIPNVFTPTYAGTLGVDNKFYIQTENIDTWSLVVYNRWGVEVFKSTDPNQYWTGITESGEAAPAGVYYYLIVGSCQSSNYKKDGYIQLIR